MYKSFREHLADDLNIFVEVDEFARWTEVDGVLLKAQFQASTSKKSGNEKWNYPALYGDYSTLYFKTADYTGKREKLPVEGQDCYVNRKRYTVLTSEDDLGMTKLTLSAYRQNTLRSVGIRGTSNVYGTNYGN